MDSPLAGFVFPSSDSLRLAEVPFLTQVNLRLDPKGAGVDLLELHLPLEPGAVTRVGDRTALWLGPDEWLLVGPPGTRFDLGPVAGVAGAASIVDVSAARTAIEISGARAGDLLAHGCALDLYPDVFPDGRCAQTMLAHAQVVLVRLDGVYRVLVRSSYARYLAEWLVDAAAEYVT
jgi:sarcosine oxidase, subunit gamma